MGQFLVAAALSEKIREIVKGAEAECAVAFWGKAAGGELFGSEGPPRDASIVCNIDMQATTQAALIGLGAPLNEKLLHLNGLHAKVYLSNRGAVVCSANASSNGVGFGESSVGKLIEAGSFYEPGSQGFHDAASWFDQIWDQASPVDAAALSRAPLALPAVPRLPVVTPRAGSLLDRVRLMPERFAQVGFVFTTEENDPVDVERTKKAAITEKRGHAKIIRGWPANGMFTGWKKSEAATWPTLFFEFWMPAKRLYVIARRVEVHVASAGSVLVKRDWRALKGELGADLPGRELIDEVDGELVQRILKNGEGRLFRSGLDLAKELESL